VKGGKATKQTTAPVGRHFEPDATVQEVELTARAHTMWAEYVRGIALIRAEQEHVLRGIRDRFMAHPEVYVVVAALIWSTRAADRATGTTGTSLPHGASDSSTLHGMATWATPPISAVILPPYDGRAGIWGAGISTEPPKMGRWSGYAGAHGRRIERPPELLAQKTPSRKALGLELEEDPTDWPLAAKEVTTVNWARLRQVLGDSEQLHTA